VPNMPSVNTREGALSLDLRGDRLNGFWAEPDSAGPFPGVLVIHEISGLTDHIRAVARRLAEDGYVALAIDLFGGRSRAVCLARIFYGILVRPLANGTVGEVQSALDALRRHAKVDPRRAGVIGFCMGGSYALQLACVDGEMRAASVFYAQNPRPLSALAEACPVVGSYPERDFTAGAARELEAWLDAYQVPHDIKIYPGARHSFFNPNGHAHDPVAADDAWRRTMAFFEAHLRGAGR
jgi:carboxymethylenebutenolidase